MESASNMSSPLSSVPSSPLSSIASVSPSPPSSSYPAADYPSPSSINLFDDVPVPEAPKFLDSDRDGPPAKRRRVMTPKERTTEYLDLRSLGASSDPTEIKRQEDQLARLTKVLRRKRKIVVIAGAGISVSAGIPDFRSSTGLFTTLRSEHKLKASGKHLFDAAVYKNDDSTSSFHDMVRELSHLTQEARPTPFHHMLATLAKEGRLLRLYSQNIDGIDTRLPPLATNIPLNAKGPWPKTVQLHGGLEKMVCSKCSDLTAFDAKLFEGSNTPACPSCEGNDQARLAAGMRGHGVGRLRPRMVLYNEFNPDDEAIGAVSHADLKSRPDAVIVVGTSLKVPGVRRIAREMCAVARGRRDGFTAWINNDPEPMGLEFKDSWDMVIRGPCDEVARHACLPLYNEDPGEYQLLPSEENKPRISKDNSLSVVLESKLITTVKDEGGILTPTASPKQQNSTTILSIGKVKQPKLFQTTSKSTTDSMLGQPAEKNDTNIIVKAKPATKTKTAAKRATGAKKTVGRPRKNQDTKPNSKITTAFHTSKKNKAVLDKDSKVPLSEDIKAPLPASLIYPNVANKQDASSNTSMHQISKLDVRQNSLSSSNNDDEEDDTHDASFVTCPEAPNTPVMVIQAYDHSSTISPPSKPTNMGRLID